MPTDTLNQLRERIAKKWREERLAIAAQSRGRRGNQDARAVATSLLAELHGPPPPPPPPRPLPAWRTVSSKKLAEARLLLLLSKGDSSVSSRERTLRCGKCEDCLAGDCGECASCLDKPKFGGRGCRKQACKMRQCAYARKFAAQVTKRVKS